MAKEQYVIVEWVDVEHHQVEVDANNIKDSLPAETRSSSRAIGVLVYADERRLILSGTKHSGGTDTYRDLLVIPQGMVTAVYELQKVAQLYPPEVVSPPPVPQILLPKEKEEMTIEREAKHLRAALEEHDKKKSRWGFGVSRKEASTE